MSNPSPKPAPAQISLPAIPVLAVTASGAALLSEDGEISSLTHDRARLMLNGPVMVCHAPYTRHRMGVDDFPAFDVLELFAFVHPAKFCVPTPAGLARVLGLSAPKSLEDSPFTILECAQTLLADLQKESRIGRKSDPVAVAGVMALQGKGWNWAPFIFSAFGETYNSAEPVTGKTSFNVWRYLPEWSETAPPPPPDHQPVTGQESRDRLTQLLNAGTHMAEARPQQAEYATALTAAFAPVQEQNNPNLVLAEAGTGVGKTLGYLAPASVWAEKNDGPVWISTYTKNLQRQIGQELTRLYADPDLRDRQTAIRKGRENYLCLLNLEDAANGAALARNPMSAIAAGLMARWAEVTRDGDMQGGDFPGWLPGLLGYAHTMGMADRRGECIYGACDHYHRCFVERAIRKASRAKIVVANHALVMIQSALNGGAEGDLPQRYVFDEGHHLFDAADSAFAAHLSAQQSTDLRRWILGAEGGKKSRARGLKRRVEDLIAGDDEAEAELQHVLHNATCLASQGWTKRMKDQSPLGAAEEFLHMVYAQVMARAEGKNMPYSLETPVRPLNPGLPESAMKLKAKLRDLQKPMRALASRLRKKLVDHADTWDSETRKRVESVCVGIERRAEHELGSWISMLDALTLTDTPENFVDWMEVERIEGQAVDVGLYRHHIDPMIPFAATLRPHAHGIAVTSATLRDRTGNGEEEDWKSACHHTGAEYLSAGPTVFSTPSPYDYAAQTRIFIVRDVRKDDVEQVASAYRALFEAAGGGSLGLFTSIQRLRAVHERILKPLEEKEIRLYAQHADEMDTGTLVDIFREDTHACLLGTDAVRDGMDVPGESLRLLVYDRVPWPRKTILHKARREKFGGEKYDDQIIRLRLRQAYGRLVRRATDKGVFVMLDSGLPSRLLTAFPDGVAVEKTGLADVCTRIKEFL